MLAALKARADAAPLAVDALVALAFTAAAGIDLATSGDLTPGRAAAAALATLSLTLRRRAPLLAVAGAAAGVTLEAVAGSTWQGHSQIPTLCLLVALYSVGARLTLPRAAAGTLIALAGLFGRMAIGGGADQGDVAGVIVVVLVVLVVGRAFRELSFETDVLEERASRLERDRDERAREAVADERARIARELHDVIGHSISVMGVQAAGVRRLLREEQSRERDALLAVERTGRHAVSEMRRLIGLLREDEMGTGEPQPTLQELGRLTEEMRAAGLSVDLRAEGSLAGLPPGVDLAGFRVVQEALTNVLKHAPRSSVSVLVRHGGGALEIEVEDDGRGSAARSNGHVGHGLVGMRERVSLYRGSFTAGPRRGGGFSVRASIPIEGA